MIIVTGGAGFIGSNLIKTLNGQGRSDILVVDNLKHGIKFRNLADLQIENYIDKHDFIEKIRQDHEFSSTIDMVFHQGACSVTTEWDGHYMMKNNYEYSKELLHYCVSRQIPFIYASSAAVYGANTTFQEMPANELPLNVYGYSKLLFDQYVRQLLPKVHSQIVGLRYFNVYGPRESHKGSMASVAYHLNVQANENKLIKLFEGCDGYKNGEQRRDFIYVEDVVNVNLWFSQNSDKSGIFNLGTGRSQTFNDVAKGVLAYHQGAKLEYIAFPAHLKGRYQSFTEADISSLRDAGYDQPFLSVEQGVQKYMEWLNGQSDK